MTLFEDILSRLWVKSLVRFKCVSKAWHTLISSRQFAKSHFQRASQNPNCMNVLVLTDNCVLSVGYRALFWSRVVHGQPVDVDFHGFPLWGEEDVETNLASCNGLVCFELYNADIHTSQYLVWNPSTKSYQSKKHTKTNINTWFNFLLALRFWLLLFHWWSQDSKALPDFPFWYIADRDLFTRDLYLVDNSAGWGQYF